MCLSTVLYIKTVLIFIYCNNMGGVSLKREKPTQSARHLIDPLIEHHSEIYLEEAVFRGENLQEIASIYMKDLLHKNIGALLFKCRSAPREIKRGSGLLISPDLVLTSAQNIYNGSLKEEYCDFEFFPGQCGTLNEGYKVEDYYFAPQFRIEQTPSNDYALLKLSKKVKRDEFIALNGEIQKVKKNQSKAEIALFGYPKLYYKQPRKSGERESTSQWGLIKSGKIIDIRGDQDSIIHLISSLKGQSGSPILLIQDERLTVIGIHKGGVMRDGKIVGNIGRIITLKLIQILREKAEQMGAVMFKVHPQPKLSEIQQMFQRKIAYEYLQEGLQLQKANKFEQAIQIYNKVIKIDPNDAKAHFSIGVVLHGMNRKEQALKSYRRAIQIDPNFAIAHDNIGGVLYEMDRKEQALESYRRVLQIDPNYAAAYNSIGVVLHGMNRKEQALETINKFSLHSIFCSILQFFSDV